MMSIELYRSIDKHHTYPMKWVSLPEKNVNCHYFSNFHVDLKKVSCRRSNLRIDLCHVDNIFAPVDRFHVACRF